MASSSNTGDDIGFEHDTSGSSLEIDSDERDSAFGDSDSILTMSVTSSVYDYRYENGRRYHAYAEGKYPVPNDEIEKDRLDLQHHAFRLTLDGALYRAPIPKDVQNVLDVGTGTGIWAIEFAEEHPSATVLGTDLSPIQPTEVPPNCSFLIDDCDNEWIFREQFDFIHTRAMVAALKDWPHFFEQAYRNLKPGGYIECQEITFPAMATDPTLTPETSPMLRWSELFGEAAAQIGLDHTAPRKLGPMLRDQGFVDIHAKTYNWPIGRWAKGKKNKLLGRFVLEDVHDWLPSSALALFTRVLKWSREEVELFLASVRQELRDKTRHFYAHVIVWTARKPEASHQYAGDYVFSATDEGQLESDDDNTVVKANPDIGGTAAEPEAAGHPLPSTALESAAESSVPTQQSGPAKSSSSAPLRDIPLPVLDAIAAAKEHHPGSLQDAPKSNEAFVDSVISLAARASEGQTADAIPLEKKEEQPTHSLISSQDFASALGPAPLRPNPSHETSETSPHTGK